MNNLNCQFIRVKNMSFISVGDLDQDAFLVKVLTVKRTEIMLAK
jgi:hypothetical protein